MTNNILNRLKIWALIFPVILLTSCFDITEEYHINSDGSGEAKMSVDMSKMLELMKSFGAKDTTGQYDKMVDSMFDNTDQVDSLYKIPGISNVKNLNDKSAGIIAYSYHFANLEALNMALSRSKMSGELGISKDGKGQNTFSMKGKTFSRKLVNETSKESEDVDSEMAAMMFKDANYTIVYHFSKPVKKVKGKNVVVEDGRKKVTVKSNLADMLKGESNLSVSLKMK